MPFTIGDPRESISSQGPQSQGRIGGEVRATGSGYVNAAPQSDLGPGDEIMPTYLKNLMEPYIKRKQEEGFISGAVAQLTAGAEVDVIDDEGGAISRIFGPSHYEQGAAAFRSKALVNGQAAEWRERLPDLVKLAPEELPKVLAEDMAKLRTGNKYTDDLIQGEMFNQLAPTVQLVTQERIKIAQTQARNGYRNNLVETAMNADAYFKMRATAEGNALDQEVDQSVVANFVGQLPKPKGMMDAVQQETVVEAANVLIEKHGFYGYQMMKAQGVLAPELIGQEASVKLDENYEKEARQALQLASESEDDAIFRLKIRMEKAKLGPDWYATKDDPEPIPVMEAVMQLRQINTRLRQKTGIEQDFYSVEDIRTKAFDIIEAMAAGDRAAANRAYQTAERRATEDFKKFEDEQKARRSEAAYHAGVLTESKDIDQEAVKHAAIKATDAGDYKGLIRNYEGRQTFLPDVARSLQAPITASYGLGYTNDLDKAREAFEKLNEQSHATAMAYYGTTHYPAMVKLSNLVKVKGMPPQMAWMSVYGEKIIGPNIDIKPEYRKEATATIDTWLEKNKPGGVLTAFGIGPKKWNASAARAARNSITDYVATIQDSNMSMEQKVGGALSAKMAEGSLEGYGPFMWEQRPGSVPLHQKVGVPKATLDGAFYRHVDAELRKVSNGAVSGSSDEFDIMRQPNPDGTDTVIVWAGDGKGKTYLTQFTTKDLRARIDAESDKTTRDAQFKRDLFYGTLPGPKTLKDSMTVVAEAQAKKIAKEATRETSPTKAAVTTGKNVLQGLQTYGKGRKQSKWTK